jgi:uncharacterized protein (TIGR03086 family)
MDVAQLKAAQDSVVAALRWAEEDQWTEATPCPDWDVRALVGHLITGNERFVVRLAGDQPGPPTDRSDASTRDLVDTYDNSNVEVLEAFQQPAAMQRVSEWPIGPLQGTDALGLKITETLVHGWDLQQALGTTIDFDPATIAEAYTWSEPMLTRIPEGRNPFGTPQPCPEDAPPLDRLAALLGRQLATVR